MTLTNTIRHCPYGHVHRDGPLVCGYIHKESKRVRVTQRRGVRAANRWRLNRGIDPEDVQRTHGWLTW